MKYEVNYACGHTGTVQLFGKGSEREWRLKKMREDICPECAAKEKKEIADKMIIEDRENALPDLTGSEKQIQWAIQIRRKKMEEIDASVESYVENIGEDEKGKLELVLKCLDLFRKNECSSREWIDMRNMEASEIIYQAYLKYNADVKEMNEKRMVEEERETVETLKPETPDTNLVAKVVVDENNVIVKLPEKNGKFIGLMKSWNFSFNKANAWERQFSNAMNVSAENFAADIANRLLANGYIVRISDDAIREMVVKQTFEPERKKVVTEIDGKFAFRWISNLNWFDELKRLPKARWKNPFMLIPVEYHNDVFDFAEYNDFFITEKAHNLKNKFVAELENAPVIEAKEDIPEEKKTDLTKPPVKLEVEKIEIDRDLRDE